MLVTSIFFFSHNVFMKKALSFTHHFRLSEVWIVWLPAFSSFPTTFSKALLHSSFNVVKSPDCVVELTLYLTIQSLKEKTWVKSNFSVPQHVFYHQGPSAQFKFILQSVQNLSFGKRSILKFTKQQNSKLLQIEGIRRQNIDSESSSNDDFSL